MKGIFIIEYSKDPAYYSGKQEIYKKQYIDGENILSLEYIKETRIIEIIYKTPCELSKIITDVKSVGYYSDYETNVKVNI